MHGRLAPLARFRAAWEVAVARAARRSRPGSAPLSPPRPHAQAEAADNGWNTATEIKQTEESKQYACADCHEVFNSFTSHRRHRNLKHSTDERYNCKVCGLRMGDTGLLKKHLATHEAPRHKCRYCGKALKSAQILVEHERTHTGERPLRCQLCDFATHATSNLSRHNRLVHGKISIQQKNKAF